MFCADISLIREQLPQKIFSCVLAGKVKIYCKNRVNYAKLISFNFGNFCTRYMVLSIRVVASTNQLMTKNN